MSTPETLTRELAALDDALAGRPVDPDLADLAELAILVRDERPAPDPAFANSLDERARRGFPRTPKRRRAFPWPKFTLPALGVAASVLLVVVIATSIPDFLISPTFLSTWSAGSWSTPTTCPCATSSCGAGRSSRCA